MQNGLMNQVTHDTSYPMVEPDGGMGQIGCWCLKNLRGLHSCRYKITYHNADEMVVQLNSSSQLSTLNPNDVVDIFTSKDPRSSQEDGLAGMGNQEPIDCLFIWNL